MQYFYLPFVDVIPSRDRVLRVLEKNVRWHMHVSAVTTVSPSRTDVVMSDSRRVIHHTSSLSGACETQSIFDRASWPTNIARESRRKGKRPSDGMTVSLAECARGIVSIYYVSSILC